MNKPGFERLEQLLTGLGANISPCPTDGQPNAENVSLSFEHANTPKGLRVNTALARIANNGMLATLDGLDNLKAGPAFIVGQVLPSVGFIELRDLATYPLPGKGDGDRDNG